MISYLASPGLLKGGPKAPPKESQEGWEHSMQGSWLACQDVAQEPEKCEKNVVTNWQKCLFKVLGGGAVSLAKELQRH